MSSKAWLSTYGVIAVLALGGGGYYAASSYGKYRDALDSWDAKVSTVESMERKAPYPNDENFKGLSAKVDSYKTSVTALSQTLNSFQRPLNTELRNTDFQVRVKTKVEEFRKAAAQAKMEIESSSDFQLGFDSYANTMPGQDLVPILDYELEAIDHMLQKLLTCGAEKLSEFQRDPIFGESAGPKEGETGTVHKYPVRYRFTGSYDSLQKFINELANDREFFYIVRVMKVQNSSLEGARKLATGGDEATTRYEDPSTKQVATAEMLAEWGQGTASEEEVAAKAKAAGFIKADLDARVLMGLEKLNVYLVVDITRFDNTRGESSEETSSAQGKKEGK